MKLLADASIPLVVELFEKNFELSLYQHESQIQSLIPEQDILFCRSTLKVDESLLKQTKIQCIATASSGVDHINLDYLKKRNIALIDAKGSNARAVADYVMACVAWLEQQQRLQPKKAAVIGVGCVGRRVVERLQAAHFEVICYDPLQPMVISCVFEDILDCDLICIHANLHETPPYSSRHLLNANHLKLLKPHVVVINASRGDIIHEQDLLNIKNPIVYCTDVYSHEPAISAEIVNFATLCTPHIAGHSIEAKQKASIQVNRALCERYHLSPPSLSVLSPDLPELTQATWQQIILDIYNPIHETQSLKDAFNKKEAFETLRREHRYRHDFNVYPIRQLDSQSLKILGG